MNFFEYWIGHCWMTGWQSIRGAFKIWCDLMQSNYEVYALLKTDDPLQECIEWFWTSLGEDNTHPKEFLEYLVEISDKIDRGEIELILMNLSDLDEIDDLLNS